MLNLYIIFIGVFISATLLFLGSDKYKKVNLLTLKITRFFLRIPRYIGKGWYDYRLFYEYYNVGKMGRDDLAQESKFLYIIIKIGLFSFITLIWYAIFGIGIELNSIVIALLIFIAILFLTIAPYVVSGTILEYENLNNGHKSKTLLISIIIIGLLIVGLDIYLARTISITQISMLDACIILLLYVIFLPLYRIGLKKQMKKHSNENNKQLELENILGNLVNRVVVMSNKYFDGRVESTGTIDAMDQQLKDLVMSLNNKVSSIDTIFEVLNATNKYMNDTTPWTLANDVTKQDRAREVLYNITESIRVCAIHLQSLLPEVAEKALYQINADMKTIESTKYFGGYVSGTKVNSLENYNNR